MQEVVADLPADAEGGASEHPSESDSEAVADELLAEADTSQAESQQHGASVVVATALLAAHTSTAAQAPPAAPAPAPQPAAQLPLPARKKKTARNKDDSVARGAACTVLTMQLLFGHSVKALQAVYKLGGEQHLQSVAAEDRQTFTSRSGSSRKKDDQKAAPQTLVFLIEHVEPTLAACAIRNVDGNLKVTQPAQNALKAGKCLTTQCELLNFAVWHKLLVDPGDQLAAGAPLQQFAGAIRQLHSKLKRMTSCAENKGVGSVEDMMNMIVNPDAKENMFGPLGSLHVDGMRSSAAAVAPQGEAHDDDDAAVLLLMLLLLLLRQQSLLMLAVVVRVALVQTLHQPPLAAPHVWAWVHSRAWLAVQTAASAISTKRSSYVSSLACHRLMWRLCARSAHLCSPMQSTAARATLLH